MASQVFRPSGRGRSQTCGKKRPVSRQNIVRRCAFRRRNDVDSMVRHHETDRGNAEIHVRPVDFDALDGSRLLNRPCRSMDRAPDYGSGTVFVRFGPGAPNVRGYRPTGRTRALQARNRDSSSRVSTAVTQGVGGLHKPVCAGVRDPPTATCKVVMARRPSESDWMQSPSGDSVRVQLARRAGVGKPTFWGVVQRLRTSDFGSDYRGSNPCTSAIARLAQRLEHSPHTGEVVGSSPSARTVKNQCQRSPQASTVHLVPMRHPFSLHRYF